MCAIYTITNTVNQRLYVGSAIDFLKRQSQHCRELVRGRHGNAKLQRAWNKYGKDAFVFAVHEVVPDPEQLLAREQYWIDTMHAVTRGYNLAPTAGSLLGFKHSDTTCQKMRDAHTGRPKSAEHVEKVRQALTGRTMTDEQRAKMRAAKLGKKRGPMSEATRNRIAESLRGKHLSETHREKLALAKLGKKLPAETRARMSAAHKARFSQTTPP